MKKVILVSGKLESGKNQFADYLKQAYEINNISIRQDLFARTLKNNCREDFKILIRDINEIAVNLKTQITEHQKYLLLTYPRHERFHTEPFNDVYAKINDLITTNEHFYEEKNTITRNLLQIYGTDIFRKRVHNNYWVELLINRIKQSQEEVTIVTDVRFPNEIELLDNDPELDIIAIRIERDMDRTKKINTHISETSLDNYINWNYIVDNNETLEELWRALELIFEELQLEPVDVIEE